jgi:SAM-dependent methyltransferase
MPHDPTQHHDAAEQQTPREFWEARYGGEQVWSGRVNATMASIVADLAPGRALDLGCGEGGDVVHLVEAGWDVTGVDISTAAVARARAAAEARGGSERVHLIAADLSDDAVDWGEHAGGASGFDLVTASFLQSPVALERERILRRAAATVVAGGHIVMVSHGAAPPWAPAEARERGDFPQPATELANLGVPADGSGDWEVLIAELREREATGPDGEPGVLEDTVVVLRRR